MLDPSSAWPKESPWAYLRLRNDRREANAYKLTLMLRGRYPVSVMSSRWWEEERNEKGLVLSVVTNRYQRDEDILVCHFDVFRG